LNRPVAVEDCRTPLTVAGIGKIDNELRQLRLEPAIELFDFALKSLRCGALPDRLRVAVQRFHPTIENARILNRHLAILFDGPSDELAGLLLLGVCWVVPEQESCELNLIFGTVQPTLQLGFFLGERIQCRLVSAGFEDGPKLVSRIANVGVIFRKLAA